MAPGSLLYSQKRRWVVTRSVEHAGSGEFGDFHKFCRGQNHLPANCVALMQTPYKVKVAPHR